MTAKASTRYKVSKKVVKRYLADHDLTQKQLAQMAGITPGALSALIRCQRDMRVGNLFALADAMRMDPRDLVEKVDEWLPMRSGARWRKSCERRQKIVASH